MRFLKVVFRRLLLAMIFLATMGVSLAGETGFPPGRVSFRAYGADQGLSNLAVGHLMQDAQGFLWVGTEAGLFRWEGSHFDEFGLQDGLPSTEITAIYQDPADVLWVGTRQGLVRWNGLSFDPIPGDQGLPQIPILSLASAEGELWVATSQGLFSQSSTGHFVASPGWPKGEASALWVGGKSSRIWAASWGSSAQVLTFEKGHWRALETPPELSKERVDSIVEDGRGRLWARTPRTLWVLEPGGTTFKQAKTPLPMSSSHGYLNAGRRGDIWIPTDTGIAHLDGDTWKVLGPKEGLPIAWSRAVFEDREGSVWVASAGLFRLLGKGAWHAYTVADGLPDDTIYRIFLDQDQQLWVGTYKGATRATAQGWEALQGTEHNAIRSIVQGSDGTIYMAGFPGNEVLTYDPKRKSLGHIAFDISPAPTRVFRLLVDDGVLWAATDGAGLLRADITDGRWQFDRVTLPAGIPNEYISDIRKDNAGRIWVAGDRGLALLEKGVWKRFTSKDGLTRDQIFSALPTRNGDVIITYIEPVGLTRARYENGSFKLLKQYDAASGLMQGKVYLTGEDWLGRIWVGSGRGLDLISPAGIEHFGSAQGLVGEDITNMAFLSEPGGDVWIGTSVGLARFDSKAHQGPVVPPNTAFTALRLGENALPPKAMNLRVPHESNTFEVRFAGLDFLYEDSVQHRVRLLGLEPEWRLSDTRQARYAALPYGQYRFEVGARVGQGNWGPVTAFEFDVLPTWWQTWWFRTLLVLTFGGLIVLIVRWRLRALRWQNQQLELQVKARTHELAAANEALENQTLTDPLTGLRNRRFLGVRMPEDVALVNRTHRELDGPRAARMNLNIDLVFIMVDLDHFKFVNDEYGHAAGDAVLKQISEVLKSVTRDTDTVVRWGGEEFLVVARQSCRRDSDILAERIRAAVENHVFDLGDGRTLRRTTSLGFSFYPFIPELQNAFAWERVVDMADQCLYAAKHGGRNAWVGIFPSEDGAAERIVASTPLNIAELVSEGILIVKTSLPPETPLDWSHKG